ncbi:MAG: hypothetical protein IEMM0003_0885 [bacterium]|nr:MAG: hypothetical protein IEMM0003_0885 [bacterium]
MNEKAITIVLEYSDGSSCKIKGSAIAGAYEPTMANTPASNIDKAKLTIESIHVHDLKETSINSKRSKSSVQIRLPVRCLSACLPVQAGLIKVQTAKLLPKFTTQRELIWDSG